ncbi:UMP kinase [Candidatus Uhrbacteria bacterium]|nr:UMP kinase [Candidatus Uhrbacteria bacterium]
MKNSPIVISLGGSIVVPKSGIDAAFLKRFATLIRSFVKSGERFILVVGGGNTARIYQQAARKVTKLADEDIDWLGIHSTRLNAHLMRTIFRAEAQHIVVKDPTRTHVWTKPLLIAAGWKPGWSTDYVATRLAKKYKAETVINLSNIAQAYDKDPAKYKDAKPLANIDWKSFRKIVGNKWIPGMNAPFDPIASRLASQSKIRVIIADGKNLSNLKKILTGKKYFGTTIE